MGQKWTVKLTDQPEQTSATVLAGCETCDIARVGLVSVALLAGLLGAMSYPAVTAGLVVGLVVGVTFRVRR